MYQQQQSKSLNAFYAHDAYGTLIILCQPNYIGLSQLASTIAPWVSTAAIGTAGGTFATIFIAYADAAVIGLFYAVIGYCCHQGNANCGDERCETHSGLVMFC
ncbi:hypothetical protein B0T25DRAFT_540229 [Lasiosphaeria hispida]|uniref:Uncharacterized protein n=1 Tax=Lasiosphaeria hispida TaxID=260671 RepID=A0AAJ0HN44_9PEZI|nr:hypothetical protein B0T25DRAFT_540229 [Lasiosphaeria hispida]